MNTDLLIELFGYLGSILVVVSMLMTSVMRLRIINTIGSTIFATYALIIHSYPTALMNVALVIINIYNMRKLAKGSKNYSLIKATSDNSFIEFMLSRYRDDIKTYFPNFDKLKSDSIVYLICCGDSPAGVFVGDMLENGSLDIKLDYTTPMYRDCSVGGFLYDSLKDEGIKKLIITDYTEGHKAYMDKMSFVKEGTAYIKNI